MRSAVYYPHTQLHSTDLVKQSLLLWDKVSVIVPWKGYRERHKDRLHEEAMELIADPLCPSEDDKKAAHEAIMEIATAPESAEWFRDGVRNSAENEYRIFMTKLLDRTWRDLNALRFGNIESGERVDEFATKGSFGLTIMATLAEVCAGSKRRLITDETAAYVGIVKGLARPHELAKANRSRRKVIAVSVLAANTNRIELKNLIALRKREEKDSGLRALRHNYAAFVEQAATAIVREAKTSKDRTDILSEFSDKARHDLAELKGELGLDTLKTLLSKETLLLVAVTAAANLTVALKDVPAGVAALFASGPLVYRYLEGLSQKRQARARHPMAYLLQA